MGPGHMGPDLTSGVTELSLRKGSFGWALKKEFEGSGEEVQQHESQAEGIGAGNSVNSKNRIKASIAGAQKARHRKEQVQGLAPTRPAHPVGLMDCMGSTERSTQATDGRDRHWSLGTFSFCPSLFRRLLVLLESETSWT